MVRLEHSKAPTCAMADAPSKLGPAFFTSWRSTSFGFIKIKTEIHASIYASGTNAWWYSF